MLDEEGLAVQSGGDELLGRDLERESGTKPGVSPDPTVISISQARLEVGQRNVRVPVKRTKLTILWELGVSHRTL